MTIRVAFAVLCLSSATSVPYDTPTTTEGPSSQAARTLAEQALSEAVGLPAGPDRDRVLRQVSRNLRHGHRDLALAAANAMDED